MYGPDPVVIMAHARILTDEQERAERRSSRRTGNDDHPDMVAMQPRAAPYDVLRPLLVRIALALTTLRGNIRPRQAS